jgi:hypothetical protein
MIQEEYRLYLYCRVVHPKRGKPITPVYSTTGYDQWGHRADQFPVTFVGDTAAICKKNAAASGWQFNPDGDVLCPSCAKKILELKRRDRYGNPL